MKNKQDFIKKLSQIRAEDADYITFCFDRLKKILDSSKVSEESIKELYNVMNLLFSIYGKFVSYNITWLKQGYMED
jgi:hypothetical protein